MLEAHFQSLAKIQVVSCAVQVTFSHRFCRFLHMRSWKMLSLLDILTDRYLVVWDPKSVKGREIQFLWKKRHHRKAYCRKSRVTLAIWGVAPCYWNHCVLRYMVSGMKICLTPSRKCVKMSVWYHSWFTVRELLSSSSKV